MKVCDKVKVNYSNEIETYLPQSYLLTFQDGEVRESPLPHLLPSPDIHVFLSFLMSLFLFSPFSSFFPLSLLPFFCPSFPKLQRGGADTLPNPTSPQNLILSAVALLHYTPIAYPMRIRFLKTDTKMFCE